MQYVDYNIASSNKEIAESNGTLSLFNLLNQNIINYKAYINRVPLRYDTSHIMVKLCNSISVYFGGTISETYDRLYERNDYFTRFYGIGHVGSTVIPANVALGDDMLINIDVPSWKAIVGGVFDTKYKPVEIYTHDRTSFDMLDYSDNLEGDGYSLMGINIPLLGAMLHDYKVKQINATSTWSIGEFLTKILVSDNITDYVNIALMNRYAQDSVNYELGVSTYVTIERIRGYASADVNTKYLQVRDEIKSTFRKIGNGTIADLNDNVPLLGGVNPKKYIPNFNDYYVDSLMWINAYAEVVQYKRLTDIANSNKLRLNLASTDRRLEMLLRPSRFKNCLAKLDQVTSTYITQRLLYAPY